jgi:hypothetical protein
MHLDALEELVRRTVKGENVAPRINLMRKKGALTAVEYKSLKSPAWRVAANSRRSGAQVGVLRFGTDAVRVWQ